MNFLKILKKNFGRPQVMTWGWPLMILSLCTALFFGLRCLLKDPDLLFPATSIIGCSVILILETLCALVFPAVLFSRGFEDRPVGHYTGAGTLILSFISGVPLMMIRIPLYNLMAYLTLRFSRSSIFPLFFHSEPASKYGIILSILCDTVIPAFGMSLYFFGFLWSRFKSTDRIKAITIITIAYVLYSMNFTSALEIAAAGVWCCFLRSRVHNMWAPFLCLISMDLSEMLMPDTLARIDLFSIQTYADIGSTYFYASLPAFFMGMVLIFFFIRVLDSFAFSVRHEITGSEYDDTIPAFDKSINLSLLSAIVVFAVVWILLLEGVWL